MFYKTFVGAYAFYGRHLMALKTKNAILSIQAAIILSNPFLDVPIGHFPKLARQEKGRH